MRSLAYKLGHIHNLHLAAQNGDVESMYNLGCFYREGRYVVIDMKTACFWWTHAAEKGHVSAQYNLGCLYSGEVSAYYHDKSLSDYWFGIVANERKRNPRGRNKKTGTNKKNRILS